MPEARIFRYRDFALAVSFAWDVSHKSKASFGPLGHPLVGVFSFGFDNRYAYNRSCRERAYSSWPGWLNLAVTSVGTLSLHLNSHKATVHHLPYY
jgi:hypothetical protein